MNSHTLLKERHNIANTKLKSIAIPKIEKYSLKTTTELVANNLCISAQTVVNYIYGRGKDGFLVEAIIKEFKEMKV